MATANQIEYGKSEHGSEFPLYQGKLLSWHLEMTWEDEKAGFPKMRTVIRAMIERRPEQLAKERYEMLRGSFDRMFGHNARKCLAVIDEELISAGKVAYMSKPWGAP
jgi:hypothetical protein